MKHSLLVFAAMVLYTSVANSQQLSSPAGTITNGGSSVAGVLVTVNGSFLTAGLQHGMHTVSAGSPGTFWQRDTAAIPTERPARTLVQPLREPVSRQDTLVVGVATDNTRSRAPASTTTLNLQ